MVEPKSYVVWGEDGNAVETITAKDANGDINPKDVKTAIDDCVSEATDGFGLISKAINNVEPDAEKCLVIKGTNMGPVVEAFAGSFESIPGEIEGVLEPFYTTAVSKHDELQTGYNEEAEAEAKKRSYQG